MYQELLSTKINGNRIYDFNPCREFKKLKVMLICTSFNSMTQKTLLELRKKGHSYIISVVRTSDEMIKNYEKIKPDLILAPMLKIMIPPEIYLKTKCLILHPGIVGDRGPSSLDWAIINKEKSWGVTVVEAHPEFDKGPIWAKRYFKMREASKSSIYQQEVVRAGSEALMEAIDNFQNKDFKPFDIEQCGNIFHPLGKWRPLMNQLDRQLDFFNDAPLDIIRKVNASDGSPGVLCSFFGKKYYVYQAILEGKIKTNAPGQINMIKGKAILVGVKDGFGIWLTHLRKKGQKKGKKYFKLPAADVLPKNVLSNVKIIEEDFCKNSMGEFKEIYLSPLNTEVVKIYFPIYNGAFSTDHCVRLQKAFQKAKRDGYKIIVFMGGSNSFCNGINLNQIEAASSPDKEAWNNINAIDDLIEEIIRSTDIITVSYMRGNVGAGGVAFALASDYAFSKEGIILNPHYLKMGLYGSEFWTYLIPKRVGSILAQKIMNECLPLSDKEALQLGLIDKIMFSEDELIEVVNQLNKGFENIIHKKKLSRKKDEIKRPLSSYRQEELKEMYQNIFGDNLGFSFKRKNFVYKK